MEQHSGQNRFSGSVNTRRPPAKGGLQNVIARHTIGAYPCWCQGELCWVDLKTGLQTWPGASMGLPHPRAALTIEEIEKMVSIQTEITRSDLKGYPKKVLETVMTLVND